MGQNKENKGNVEKFDSQDFLGKCLAIFVVF